MNPSEEQLLQAFEQAPSVIQNSLSGGSAVEFMSSLPERYGLHVDTAGYVSEFIRNMLLGFLRPTQFVDKLHSVGISDEVARSITTDLNREVFIPLRDIVRTGGQPASSVSIPQVSIMSVGNERSVEPVIRASEKPVPSYNLIREDTTLAPPVPASQPPTPSAVAAAPVMRTMQHDIEMVETGHLPDAYPIQRSAAPMPHASETTPATAFQTSSIPVTEPQQPRPVPVPSQPVVREIPQIAQPAAPNLVVPAPSSSDPYREAI